MLQSGINLFYAIIFQQKKKNCNFFLNVSIFMQYFCIVAKNCNFLNFMQIFLIDEPLAGNAQYSMALFLPTSCK